MLPCFCHVRLYSFKGFIHLQASAFSNILYIRKYFSIVRPFSGRSSIAMAAINNCYQPREAFSPSWADHGVPGGVPGGTQGNATEISHLTVHITMYRNLHFPLSSSCFFICFGEMAVSWVGQCLLVHRKCTHFWMCVNYKMTKNSSQLS